MAREAEPDSDQQLLRRRRRLFSSEERSFRMDRRSPAAAALRSAVSDLLHRFLGSYSDNTLEVTPNTDPLPLFPCRAREPWNLLARWSCAVGGGVDAFARIRFWGKL